VPVYYLEPSALVKYYVTEPGGTWVRQVVDAEANVLVSAEITIAEVAAALGVIARTGRISRRQLDAFWGKFTRDLLQRYEFLPTRRTIITCAAALCLKHPLRGFDAIHLASGLQLQETLVQQEAEGDALARCPFRKSCASMFWARQRVKSWPCSLHVMLSLLHDKDIAHARAYCAPGISAL